MIPFRLEIAMAYSYRIRSDYEGAPVEEHNLGGFLETVKQIIQIVDEKGR